MDRFVLKRKRDPPISDRPSDVDTLTRKKQIINPTEPSCTPSSSKSSSFSYQSSIQEKSSCHPNSDINKEDKNEAQVKKTNLDTLIDKEKSLNLPDPSCTSSSNDNDSSSHLNPENQSDHVIGENSRSGKNEAISKKNPVFNDKWLQVPEYKNWLIAKEHKGNIKPMCNLCQLILSNHRPNIQRHAESTKHIAILSARSSTPSVERIIKQDPVEAMARRAELKIAGLLATKNLPFTLCEDLVPLVKNICPDSKIAMKMAMGRTKTTAVMNNVLGPHFENKLNDTLKQEGFFFSLIMDETTDQSTKKQCAVTAIYFNENKLTTSFLTMVEVDSGTAKNLFSVLIDTLKERNIPLHNLVGFSSDTTNSMVGEHNSVFSHLKEAVPHMICIKCSCHMIHLAASNACLKMPRSVEDMLRNIAAHFSRSHGRQKKLKEFQEFFELQLHKILSPASTRWLSLKQCVDRVLEQYLALQEHFRVEVFEDPSRTTDSILVSLNNNFMRLYLEFMSYTLDLLNDFNLLFQSETPLLHKLKPEIEKLIKTLAVNYLKFNYCKATSALQINPSTPSNFLELDKIYLGVLAQTSLAELKQNIKDSKEMEEFDKKVETYKKDCLNFYIELIKQIKKRFDFSDDIFKILEILDPSIAKSYEQQDLTYILQKFPNLRAFVTETGLQKEWREHALLDHDMLGLDSSLEPLQYWNKVLDLKNAAAETRFPNLKKVIRLLLVLPFSNASVERVFSKLKRTKTENRNKLDTTTLAALMHTSDGIQGQGGILKYEPSKNLLGKKISYSRTK